MFLDAKEFELAKKYWLNKLSGELKEIRLLRDFAALKHDKAVYANFKLDFKNEVVDQLRRTSKSSDLSLFVILLAVFKILLYKYTGQKDIVVSSTIFSQLNREYNKWLFLRDILDVRMTGKDLLVQLKQTVTEGYKNQHYPFRRLLEFLNTGKDLSLFRVIFLLENLQEKEFISDITADFEIDIMFLVRRKKEQDGIEALMVYNSNLFKEETIHLLVVRYFHILSQVLNHWDKKIIDIRISSEEEKKRVLFEFNDTRAGYPPDKTIHGLFRQQVERTPDHIAVIGDHETYEIGEKSEREGRIPGIRASIAITYGQLNKQTNKLAYQLKRKGVTPDSIVGILAERSPGMIVAMLAVLKAGGGYLPIDTAYPKDRTCFMLKDSNINLLLTQKHLMGEDTQWIKELASPTIIMVDEETMDPGETGNLETLNTPRHLLYVIYTSGSTGRPKGVLINHNSFVNLIYFHRQVFAENGNSRMSQVAGPGFDAMAFEVWPCLLSGASLHIVDNETRIDPQAMKEWLIKNQITISFQSTMMVERLLREQWPTKGVALKALRTAGDKLVSYPQHPYPFQLYNLYGPTEDTVWTTWAGVHIKKQRDKEPVIGKPTANKKIYIIGTDNQLQPIGIAGELVISGSGLARGYLNDPELTCEKFDHDLWDYQDEKQKAPGKRIYSHMSYRSYKSYISKKVYKTGDLARWLTDGNLEFLGRLDFQVKIRGHRVELGEIESQLFKHPLVREAVVTIREDNRGEKYLCAYFTADTHLQHESASIIAELRQSLAVSLPNFMIPNYFVEIEKIPITPNGKVDREKLPKPKLEAGEHYAPPRDETEKKLVEIWSKLLSADGEVIGIDDNFFEIGGHSLEAIHLITSIHKDMGVQPLLGEIFKRPTIRELAGYINGISKVKFVPQEIAEKKEYYALSPAQQRLYILQQMDIRSIGYNMLVAAWLEGSLHKKKLEDAFVRLIRRHESLRTSFIMVKDEPVQEIHSKVEFKIEYYDASQVQVKDGDKEGTKGLDPLPMEPPNRSWQIATSTIKNFIRPFDLSRSPLLRVGLIKNSPQDHILVVDMHHIISDGISHDVLVRDFMALYAGEELQRLRLQYKDYSEWLRNETVEKKVKNQGTYWLKQFSGDIPVLNLPMDYPRPPGRSFEGSTSQFEIAAKETGLLNALALQEGATLFMALLAIFNILLAKLSGSEDVVVGTPAAGRRHADLESLIGVFINTLALRNYPAKQKTFREFLKEVSQCTWNAFENQDYPLENLVEKVAAGRDSSRNPLFDVVFTFQQSQVKPDVLKTAKTPGQQELKLKPYDLPFTISQFDLIFWGEKLEEKMLFTVLYCKKLFKPETIQWYIKYYKEILDTVLEKPDIPLQEIHISHDLFDQKIAIPQTEFGF